MADAFKDFLISVGWRVDQGSQQRFVAGVGATDARVMAMQKSLNEAAAALINLGKQFQGVAGDPTKKFVEAADKIKKRNEELRKGVQELGRFAVGTATIFAAGVREVAKNFEQLYYVSQRTGASVESLTNLKFAFQQIGLGGDEAVQAISNFSRTLRDFPGKGVLLRNLIRPEDVAYVKKNFGDGLDSMTANFEAFIHRLSQISDPWLRTRYAEAFGISGDLADRLVKNEEVRAKAFQEHAEALKRIGLNQKELEDESVNFIQNLNRLWENVSLIFQKSAHEAMPYLNTLTTAANDFIRKVQEFDNLHPGAAMAEGIGAAAAAYLGLAAVIGSLTGNFLGLKAAAMGAIAVIRSAATLGPVGAFVAGMWPKPAGQGEDEALRKRGGHPLTGPGEAAPKTWSGVWEGIKGLFPHFQQGGIVRADLHDGEAVLPSALTAMLLRVSEQGGDRGGVDEFSSFLRALPSRGWGNQPSVGAAPIPTQEQPRYSAPIATSEGGDRGILAVLDNILEGLQAWWFGSAAYRPLVIVKKDEIGDDKIDFAGGTGGRRHGDPLGVGTPRTGSGREGPARAPVRQPQNIPIAMKFLTGAAGLTPEQAAGVTGWLIGESGLDPNARNNIGGGHTGIGQLDKRRWPAFLQRFEGDTSFDKQLQNMLWEWRNTETKAFAAIRGSSTVAEANAAMEIGQRAGLAHLGLSNSYDALRQFKAAGGVHRDGDKNVTITQTNTVHVQHGDPLGGQEIGRHVIGAHRRMAGDLVRSFRTALA